MTIHQPKRTLSFSVWLYMTWALAWKNIRVKYKNSLLGLLWSLVNPLIFLLIFSYVFGHAFPEIENYTLYALTGLVMWSLFPVATTQIIQSLIDGAPILKSIAVPVITFPVSAMLSSVIQFLFTLIPFGGIMLALDYQPSIHLLFTIPVLICYLAFVSGLSFIISAVNIYFRDAGLLWNTLLPAVFYFTPIAYPVDLIPENIRWVMHLNPVYHFIDPFRKLLYYQVFPDAMQWVWMIASGAVFLLIGLFVFHSLKRGFISHY
jgi:ABC-2 type transport system permease protein